MSEIESALKRPALMSGYGKIRAMQIRWAIIAAFQAIALAAAASPQIDSPNAAIEIAKQTCAKKFQERPSHFIWEAFQFDKTWEVRAHANEHPEFGMSVSVPRDHRRVISCDKTFALPGTPRSHP